MFCGAPTVFSHKMRDLIDPESKWTVVAYTEMAPMTTAFILTDAYHNCSLWAFSRYDILNIRALKLGDVLGNQTNEDYSLKFLAITEATHFTTLPAT